VGQGVKIKDHTSNPHSPNFKNPFPEDYGTVHVKMESQESVLLLMLLTPSIDSPMLETEKTHKTLAHLCPNLG